MQARIRNNNLTRKLQSRRGFCRDSSMWVAVWIAATVLAVQLQQSSPGVVAFLVVGYYDLSCPNVETIVSTVVANAYQQDEGTAPGLVRLHFHDCFVQVL